MNAIVSLVFLLTVWAYIYIYDIKYATCNNLIVPFSSRKKDDKREKSLSPLSKRMALMDPTHDGDGKEYRNFVV